eukprot:771676-Pyramimonas_sp.AAC.1
MSDCARKCSCVPPCHSCSLALMATWLASAQKPLCTTSCLDVAWGKTNVFSMTPFTFGSSTCASFFRGTLGRRFRLVALRRSPSEAMSYLSSVKHHAR